MNQPIVFDIETVTNDRAAAYFAAKEYEPDARLKDPDKIAESINEKRRKDAEKAALYWWTGRVICICAKFPDSDVPITASGDDERAVLCEFFDLIPAGAWMLAKSGDYFDIPYLVGRSLFHNIGVPDWLRPSRSVQDVNHIFGFGRSDQVTNLANYAFGLDLGGKLAHGSDVAGMHAEGRWDDIRKYCAQDVAIAAEIMNRWLKPYVKGTR